VGRPRSAEAHTAVIEAALELFAEQGIDATSMDAIAEASGVSKATIYKHWPDKDALCLEVMAWIHGTTPTASVDFNSGDLRDDILSVLKHEPPEAHAGFRMRLMPHLIAHAARNAAFAKAWRARVMEPPRAQLTRVLQRAVEKGQLPRSLNIDLAIALLLGPIMYDRVLKLVKGPVSGSMREIVVDAFLRSYGLTELLPEPERTGRPRRRVRSPAKVRS
jgi:AcrR family transcriptional regulator